MIYNGIQNLSYYLFLSFFFHTLDLHPAYSPPPSPFIPFYPIHLLAPLYLALYYLSFLFPVPFIIISYRYNVGSRFWLTHCILEGLCRCRWDQVCNHGVGAPWIELVHHMCILHSPIGSICGGFWPSVQPCFLLDLVQPTPVLGGLFPWQLLPFVP